MKALQVEFVRQRPWSERTQWCTVMLALVAMGMSFSAYVEHREYESVARQLSATRFEAERAATAAQDAEAARRAAGPPPYQESALQALEEARTPIPAMLTALESVAVEGASVKSLEAWSTDGTARLEIEFRDYPTLLQYLTLLNEGEPLPRWKLRSAQLEQVAQGAVGSATIEGAWKSQNNGP